jgi:predicted Zn-dependent protease
MPKLVLSFGLIFLLFGCSAASSRKSSRVETFQPSKDFLHEAVKLSPEEEGTIGRAVAARILALYPVLENESLNNYLSTVGAVISAASARPNTFYGYTFRVLDTDEVNALSAPGGIIFISKGFLKLLPDEDALAAVLAHEVAHVIKLHGLLAIQPSHLASYTQVGGKFAAALDCSGLSNQILLAFDGAVKDIVDKLVTSGFSRDQEFEADQGAVQILENAGYDPKGLITALQILKTKNSKNGWFSTHPSAAERLKEIQILKLDKEVSSAQGYSERRARFLAALKGL